MSQTDALRRVEVQQADGSWQPIEFLKLQPLQTFRLFESDGTPVDGRWRVIDAPRSTDDARVYSVWCEPI